MGDFFDTGVIVGTSYVRGISYGAFDPALIDPVCKECHSRFQESKKRVISTHVVKELRDINRRRKIMHDILIMELMDADKDLIADEMISLAAIGVPQRDIDWLIKKTSKLKKLDAEETCVILEEVKQIFELNIINLVNDCKRFHPMKKANRIAEQIYKKIVNLPNMPNKSDVRIFSEALTYHNLENEIMFISADKGFQKIKHKKVEEEISKVSGVTKYPTVEIIRPSS